MTMLMGWCGGYIIVCVCWSQKMPGIFNFYYSLQQSTRSLSRPRNFLSLSFRNSPSIFYHLCMCCNTAHSSPPTLIGFLLIYIFFSTLFPIAQMAFLPLPLSLSRYSRASTRRTKTLPSLIINFFSRLAKDFNSSIFLAFFTSLKGWEGRRWRRLEWLFLKCYWFFSSSLLPSLIAALILATRKKEWIYFFMLYVYRFNHFLILAFFFFFLLIKTLTQ